MSVVFDVQAGDYDLEDPWALPEGCEQVALTRAIDGKPAALATTVGAYYDDTLVTFVFRGADAGVVATHYEHDAPLYEEDVVELFLAPATPAEYFELEVNPLGTTFDARISSPDGVRATMLVETAWTCEGLFAAVRRTGDCLEVVVRVSFASLGRATPLAGEEWRANFFRIDRGPGGLLSFWRGGRR